MDILSDLDSDGTMRIQLNERDIVINEISGMEASVIDTIALKSIKNLIDAHEKWNNSTFELCLKHPELMLELLILSTGEDESFIKTLDARSFDVLVFGFLAVNAGFIILRTKLIELGDK